MKVEITREHLGLVRAIAMRMHASTPVLCFDDLVGCGCVGLMQAARAFDGRAGVTFETFASHRIRGAMLDGARAFGTWSRADVARFRAGGGGTVVPLDDARGVRDPGPAADESVEAAEGVRELRAAIARLPKRSRETIEAYYVAERSLANIGKGAGRTITAICRRLDVAEAQLCKLMGREPVKRGRRSRGRGLGASL